MTVPIPPLDELLLNFESLGDNCEFGVFQRQVGLEPLGLFRFSFISMPQLLRAMKNRFEKIAVLDQINIRVAKNAELMVYSGEYGFYYHVGKRAGEVEIDAQRRDEQTKLTFLTRRMIGTLTSGEKIFVRKGDTKTREEAKELLMEMQAYGPCSLLWVTEADADNPPGTVRLLEPGLMRGRIDSFAPYGDAHSVNFTIWVDICENAYLLWKRGLPVGTRLAPSVRVDQAANLLFGGNRDVQFTTLPSQARTETVCGSFPRRNPFSPSLCRHVLATDKPTMVGLRIAGLQPGAPYTFSFWARVPPGNRVSHLNIAIPGTPMIRGRRIIFDKRQVWQRLEHSARPAGDGILFPRLTVQGEPGAIVETANWRLEPGLLVGAQESPSSYPPQLLEPQSGADRLARRMRVS